VIGGEWEPEELAGMSLDQMLKRAMLVLGCILLCAAIGVGAMVWWLVSWALGI
jgi:hypothetical protein